MSDGSMLKRPDLISILQGLDFGYAVEVSRVAHMLVRRWGDYAPTEAAFRGDVCLRHGHMEGQRFWDRCYICVRGDPECNRSRRGQSGALG